MFQNLVWATGYNSFAIPLAAGILYSYCILLSPDIGAIFMSASTVIGAINAKVAQDVAISYVQILCLHLLHNFQRVFKRHTHEPHRIGNVDAMPRSNDGLGRIR